MHDLLLNILHAVTSEVKEVGGQNGQFPTQIFANKRNRKFRKIIIFRFPLHCSPTRILSASYATDT